MKKIIISIEKWNIILVVVYAGVGLFRRTRMVKWLMLAWHWDDLKNIIQFVNLSWFSTVYLWFVREKRYNTVVISDTLCGMTRSGINPKTGMEPTIPSFVLLTLLITVEKCIALQQLFFESRTAWVDLVTFIFCLNLNSWKYEMIFSVWIIHFQGNTLNLIITKWILKIFLLILW